MANTFEPVDALAGIDASLDLMNEISRRKNNPAGYMQERIMKQIATYQALLSDEEEMAIEVVGSASPSFRLRRVVASNPDMLLFSGLDADDRPVLVMQHHSQTKMLLTAVSKTEDKPYRIGFTT